MALGLKKLYETEIQAKNFLVSREYWGGKSWFDLCDCCECSHLLLVYHTALSVIMCVCQCLCL